MKLGGLLLQLSTLARTLGCVSFVAPNSWIFHTHAPTLSVTESTHSYFKNLHARSTFFLRASFFKHLSRRTFRFLENLLINIAYSRASAQWKMVETFRASSHANGTASIFPRFVASGRKRRASVRRDSRDGVRSVFYSQPD